MNPVAGSSKMELKIPDFPYKDQVDNAMNPVAGSSKMKRNSRALSSRPCTMQELEEDEKHLKTVNPVTGSSKRKRNPRKKHKLDDEVNTASRSTNINDLPDEMLIEILSYLSIQDRMKIQKVCHRWYRLVRSEVFWKHLKLSNISLCLFIEIIATLPSCVSKLRVQLEGNYEPLPISLPEIMAKLHKQCPHLNTLIFENMYLSKNFHNTHYHITQRTNFLKIKLHEDARRELEEPYKQIIETEFPKEDDIELLDAVLPELKILSLSRVLFNRFHIFSHISTAVLPKMVVLDLSFSMPFTLKEIRSDLFSSLDNLEELYLAGWRVAELSIINLLQNMTNLKVLDLEYSRVTVFALSALKGVCTNLEKLYLAYSSTGDIYRTNEDKTFFPHLQSLCLKHTSATPKGIEQLLAGCPSLKLINVCSCMFINEKWYRSLNVDFKERLCFDSEDMCCHCDHFLNTKYCNF